jgi:hypothetical protein
MHPDKTTEIVIKNNGFSVTLTVPTPPGGLWETRKRIEAGLALEEKDRAMPDQSVVFCV